MLYLLKVLILYIKIIFYHTIYSISVTRDTPYFSLYSEHENTAMRGVWERKTLPRNLRPALTQQFLYFSLQFFIGADIP